MITRRASCWAGRRGRSGREDQTGLPGATFAADQVGGTLLPGYEAILNGRINRLSLTGILNVRS